jgi:large subunit ribosomal protein L1
MAEAKAKKSKNTKAKAVKPEKSEEIKGKQDGVTQEDTKTKTEANVEGQIADKNITDITDKKKATAKAGKRSAKAQKEAEEKVAKEDRKTHAKEEKIEVESGSKLQQKPTRPKLERRSKNFRKSAELIEKNKSYVLGEALNLATQTSTVKFDATVEMHIRLGVDPRQADQNIRDIVVLPEGTGKTIRVAVFGDTEDVAAAKKAGADIAGSDEFLQQLDKGLMDFDVLIATPAQMAKLGKYARLLGPKGLMPNPKSGTVTNDVAKAVLEAKAGRVEYRVDSTGIVHLGIGKVSFGKDKLTKNAEAVIASIKAAKPGSLKGTYIKSVFVTTTMGPGISVSTTDV